MKEALPQQPPACPVVLSIPIQWGDQDAFGHVNNTRSIRWYESARMEYFNLESIVQKGLIMGTSQSFTADGKRLYGYSQVTGTRLC